MNGIILQALEGQTNSGAELAKACPDVTFILQHAGMLADQSPAGGKAWRAGMRKLAECDNVVTKLSAFGTFIHRNDPRFIEAMIKASVRLFGADR